MPLISKTNAATFVADGDPVEDAYAADGEHRLVLLSSLDGLVFVPQGSQHEHQTRSVGGVESLDVAAHLLGDPIPLVSAQLTQVRDSDLVFVHRAVLALAIGGCG